MDRGGWLATPYKLLPNNLKMAVSLTCGLQSPNEVGVTDDRKGSRAGHQVSQFVEATVLDPVIGVPQPCCDHGQ